MYDKLPTDLFQSFEDIPTVLVDLLLFIENKELLNTHPYYNPAVEYDRLAKVLFEFLKRRASGSQHRQPGGSTLATQMEKYHFSEDGRTNGAHDKLSQMASAMLRSYLDGRDTSIARRRIVLDYLNSIPLGAASGYGEVLGYGEAMRVFYQVDLSHEKELLRSIDTSSSYSTEQLQAIDRALQVVISARNPNYLSNPTILVGLKNKYINILVQEKILKSEALALVSTFQSKIPFASETKNFVDAKAQDLVRKRASSLLGVSYPELDKLDLTVKSTFRLDIQDVVTSFFEQLKDESFIAANNLRVDHLLDQTTANKVTYSFVLYELENGQSKMRASYDNFNKPFNFNDSGKMELGSTAKLRVLVSYLEAVAQAFKEKQEGKLKPYYDPISEFVQASRASSLKEILASAMLRQFSANPHQTFFTGGGIHKFQNYNKDDNGRIVSLHDAFIKSINLPFVRALQETVRFHIHRNEAFQKLSAGDEATKRQLLLQFVDKESKLFLNKFFKNLKKKDPQTLEQYVIYDLPRSVMGVAMTMSYLHSELTPEQVVDNLVQNGYDLSWKQKQQILRLVNAHRTGQYNMNDIGYVAKLHPILLYVAKQMIANPSISYTELVEQSAKIRQESYSWLFKNKKKQAQWIRVYSVLEAQGFESILDQWQRVGFPFEYIVPSLASALGSSGDKPRALAKLVGVALNGGKDFNEPIIEELHFAKDTPYEVVLRRKPPTSAEQVMTAEVAEVVKNTLRDTVEAGTAVRVRDTFKPLEAGGKTGTGDNQHKEVRADGSVVEQTALSRTATFVFYIGQKWYGSITVYVDQEEAERSTFTSSYAVTLLKLLGEQLKDKL